jgi:hypothetical protein
MYTISNSNRIELIKLLQFLRGIPGDDNKTANFRRRAKLAIAVLNRAKFADIDSTNKRFKVPTADAPVISPPLWGGGRGRGLN